jgi:hypothetical protein
MTESINKSLTGPGTPDFHQRLDCLASLYLRDKIIAVDFDGTCVLHDFPEIGDEIPGAVDVLKALNMAGAKLIIWTIRSDQTEISGDPHSLQRARQAMTDRTTEYLKNACQWFEERGIEIYGANCNHQQKGWSSSPKAYAHAYIDDAALGCPLIYEPSKHGRPFVDWDAMLSLLNSTFADLRPERDADFARWMKELQAEVDLLPANIAAMFDLRPVNDACWREDFEGGIGPADAVHENVDSMARDQ